MSTPQSAVPAVSSEARNAIRARVLNQRTKTEIITLEDGIQVEVRQTSVGSMLDSVMEEDLKRRMFKMLMLSCFVPGTDEKLFEEGDFDSVMTMPSGGYYQKLIDAVNEKKLPPQVEVAKKPSEETQPKP